MSPAMKKAEKDKTRIELLRQYKKAIASYKILKTCEFKLATRFVQTPIESDLNLLTPPQEADEELINLGYPPFMFSKPTRQRSSLELSAGLSTPAVEAGKRALKDLMKPSDRTPVKKPSQRIITSDKKVTPKAINKKVATFGSMKEQVKSKKQLKKIPQQSQKVKVIESVLSGGEEKKPTSVLRKKARGSIDLGRPSKSEKKVMIIETDQSTISKAKQPKDLDHVEIRRRQTLKDKDLDLLQRSLTKTKDVGLLIPELDEEDEDQYASKNLLAELDIRDIMDVQNEIDQLENDAEEQQAKKVDDMMAKLKQAADPRVIIRKKLDKIKKKIDSFKDDQDWGNREDFMPGKGMFDSKKPVNRKGSSKKVVK